MEVVQVRTVYREDLVATKYDEWFMGKGYESITLTRRESHRLKESEKI